MPKERFASMGAMLVLLTCASIVALVAAEAGARAIFGGNDKPRRFHPELGMTSVPSHEWTVRTIDYSTHMRTNSWGFRGAEFPRTKALDEVRIVFIGDSFVHARQVEEGERFSDRVAAILSDKWQRPVTSLSLAIWGAHPAHEFLYYRKLASTLSPDVVVQVLYPENDLPEQQGTEPYVAYSFGENGGVLTAHVEVTQPKPCPLKCLILRHSTFALHAYRLARDVAQRVSRTPMTSGVHYWYMNSGIRKLQEESRLDYLAAFARTMRDDARADGAEYLAVLIPDAYEIESQWRAQFHQQYAIPADESNPAYLLPAVESAFQERGIPVLSLKTMFAAATESGAHLYFRSDAHLNEEGHAIAARAIADRINAQFRP